MESYFVKIINSLNRDIELMGNWTKRWKEKKHFVETFHSVIEERKKIRRVVWKNGN